MLAGWKAALSRRSLPVGLTGSDALSPLLAGPLLSGFFSAAADALPPAAASPSGCPWAVAGG
jgi:hypothetical protein